MEKGQQNDNPFIVLKCPWCGAQMGLIKGTKINEIRGYKTRGSPATNQFI
jgi:hypothetical protein